MSEQIGFIREVFPSGKAWAYAVMYHGVALGIWDGDALNFHSSADFGWEYVTELRVFNAMRELRFVRGEEGILLVRDSEHIAFEETRDTAYLMYGTSANIDAGNRNWTILTEDRGGKVCFPKELKFGDETVMWLGIRNYLRFTEDLRLEVCDYAFTGFKRDKNKQEVTL